MNNIQEDLGLIFKISTIAQNHFVRKSQNEIERFVFCGIEKVSKVSLNFVRLYPDIESSKDLEFSLGILARSVLMDMILLMPVKKICSKYIGDNLADIKQELKDYSYIVLNDGTKYFLDEIHFSDTLSIPQKEVFFSKFKSLFPKAIDDSTHKPTIKKGFGLKSLKNIYNENKESDLGFADAIYNLYSYYSKYDHLSHYTSLSSHFPFDKKKGKLDLSVILMLKHLRDLLCIAYDFGDDYKMLLSLINQVHEQLKKSTDDELASKKL